MQRLYHLVRPGRKARQVARTSTKSLCADTPNSRVPVFNAGPLPVGSMKTKESLLFHRHELHCSSVQFVFDHDF
jgi:hypothetical protein